MKLGNLKIRNLKIGNLKLRNLSLAILAAAPALMSAQSAMQSYYLNQKDMKGTARFMSMGGAFGALGGDLSTLSQNPAGIGVYRSNELGFTVDIDCRRATTDCQGKKSSDDNTDFYLNNIGGVAAIKLNSKATPFFNIGFTYQKSASFNRAYRGNIPQLQNSVSNLIAGITGQAGLYPEDMDYWEGDNEYFDPYNPPANYDYPAPWISTLGYQAFMIYPETTPDPNDPDKYFVDGWQGEWENGVTSGNGAMKVIENGEIENFNIALGGNINNKVFWGMDFDIVSAHFNRQSDWTENLDNAYVAGVDFVPALTTSYTNLYNYYNLSATGFNYKLGIIYKPIQELRLGFAFHTPTWFKVDESYYAAIDYSYGMGPDFTDPQNPNRVLNPGSAETNNGVDGVNNFQLRSPWRFMVSAAGVLGSNLIVSADYEWTSNQNIYLSSGNTIFEEDNTHKHTNQDIENYYKTTHTLRLGAEFRVSDNFSVRGGYSYVSSPVQKRARGGKEAINTTGTELNYSFDNATNYVSCGLGYRYKALSLDLAYVWKRQTAEFFAYSPNPDSKQQSPRSSLAFTNNQIVFSASLRF